MKTVFFTSKIRFQGNNATILDSSVIFTYYFLKFGPLFSNYIIHSLSEVTHLFYYNRKKHLNRSKGNDSNFNKRRLN